MSTLQAHIILVAFCVYADDFADAQRRLMRQLPHPDHPGVDGIDSWWIAEDERIDGSDNDSAVFVPMGSQSQHAALTDDERAALNAAQNLLAGTVHGRTLGRLLERTGGAR